MASERIQRRIDRLLDEADEAVSRFDWGAVRQRAEAVLAFDRDNQEARAFLEAAEASLEGPASSALHGSGISAESPKPSSDSPTFFANGRYQVKEFLGEGGRKRVYRAHDSVLDRDVALAIIKPVLSIAEGTEGLDPTSRVRITREAQAMGRLGDHPHVLSIHDLGDDNGQPYMVLPLMPGGDVEALLEKAEDHKLPLEQAIDLAMQICRGLEFAHSKGIVHRDLKPGNIWLTGDGTARIGDFGLAVAIDRSRLTQEGMMVGTVSYMPPEQAMGGDVTPQSDLYSLGAMLYEMVAGRPPFLGDDSVAIIGQHINTPPVAPTWHNAGCPRALEAIILRLLAKDPSERPESVTDVLTALEGIDLAASEQPVAEHDEAHALDSLAGGVFVGRQREMGELRAALEDTLSGRGSIVTLVGEPGIGKTRTAQELATYANLRGAQVLWGRCYEEQGAPPFCPWLQAIRSHVLRSTPERLQAEMGPGAVDIAAMIPEVREKLLGLQMPPPLPPDQARFRLFESITFFLKSASQERPLVVILDNLHWSDGPSLKLLEFLAPELEGSRVLVLATYRDAELTRRHPLSQTLGELTRERLFRRVLLRGLGREDVARFIEVASGIKPPPGLVHAVHTQTEGNPLFVNEVVRLLVQEGDFGLDLSGGQQGVGERESWSIRIPEGVRVVVGRRLDRLSERCNRTLTVAAVLGREFGLDQLGPLIDELSRGELLDVLEEALAARVIEPLPQEPGRYQFTHSLVQHTLAEELSATRRVRLHARIAETLEELYGEQSEAHAAELAQHFFEAAAVTGTEKLVRYSLLSGERRLDEYAFEEALGYFQRALAAKEGQAMDDEQAALLYGLGKAQAAILQVRDAQSSLTRAFDYYVEVGDVSKTVGVAEYPVASGNLGFPELVVRALELVPPDSHEAGRLLSQHGFNLGVRQADYVAAQEAFDQALEIAEREEDVALQMWTLARAGRVGFFFLRHQECIVNDEQAVDLNRGIGDPNIAPFSGLCVVGAQMHIGDLEGARTNLEAMLNAAESARFRSGLVTALWSNAMFSLAIGDWESAREVTERGLSISPYNSGLLDARLFMEFTLGDFEQGEGYLKRIQELIQKSPPGSLFSHVAIILVDILAGSVERFDAAKEAARATLSSQSITPMYATEANMALALIAVQEDDREEAEGQYAALEPYRTTAQDHTLLSMDRLLGLLAKTMVKLDDAQKHFEDGLAFCRKAGYRPELARSLYDYADMLLDRDADGDRQKAIALLDESLAISSDLGMRPLIERVLARKMSLQGIDVSSPETSIDAVVSAVEVERPNLQPHAAPDGTVTVMFTDIENFTPMNERLGDVLAQDVLRIHNAIIREQVAASEGFEVKSQGDGFMVAFSSARRALECAIAIQRALATHNAELSEEPIRVRIGLHTGEAIKEGEDFFGKTVIVAARIASQAVGGQILVSSLLKALVEGSGRFEFGEPQAVGLKGLAGEHQVFEARWDEKA